MKKTLVLLVLLLAVFFGSFGISAAEGPVYVVTIDRTIDRTAESLLEKAIQEANLGMAELLIVEVDTYGGYLDNAIKMKDAIMSSPVPTVTFVNRQALSAGSLISLAGQQLYMAPGSVIGAAEARTGDNEKADEKTMSAWVAELTSTAEARGKDKEVAAAFADTNVVIEGVSEEGTLLTLSDGEAKELNISNDTANSYRDICELMGVTATETVTVEVTVLERFAGFVTNPIVSGILIALGIIGIVIELITAGFGVSGILGLCALAIYFAGHMVLNSIGWVALVLFLVGLLFIILEIFVIPGFGIAGIAGGIAILATVFMLAPSPASALLSLLIAVVVTVVVLIVSFKNMKTRKIWRRFVLKDRTDADSGYTAPNMDNEQYLGKVGVATSILRPAGAIDLDGERVDVITEGEFLAAGTRVKVIGLDGTRIIVRAVREQDVIESVAADPIPDQEDAPKQETATETKQED